MDQENQAPYHPPRVTVNNRGVRQRDFELRRRSRRTLSGLFRVEDAITVFRESYRLYEVRDLVGSFLGRRWRVGDLLGWKGSLRCFC